jgi:hypothetical protein
MISDWIGKDVEERCIGLSQGTSPEFASKENNENFSQDSQSPSRDLNSGISECQAKMAIIRPRGLV